MDVVTLRNFEKLGPFEIKDELIRVAQQTSQTASIAFLNAGRGNPNWVATKPRGAFFKLGEFAIIESQRVMDRAPGIGGMPKKAGIAQRLEAWLAGQTNSSGATFLQEMVQFAIGKFAFEPDAFVHELVDSIIGDNYPVPDRMLKHNEKIVHEYLMWAMCGEPRPAGQFDIYAVEGGTAAMCYIFKSLKSNRLLNPGDTIALGAPIFTPYLEMPHLEDYGLDIVTISAPQENRFQYTDAELAKLEDPKVKAFFVVNPGNPYAVALSSETIDKIVKLVKTKRPDLMLLTDDVYGTFVNNFHGLLGALPQNTIGVYSYSKYFGCTGWRLGTIALHQDNIFDAMIARHPEDIQAKLDKRYGTLTLKPRQIKLIDRIVADSRDVALNHTAGLSLPQQVMMTMFSLAEMMDTAKDYQKGCMHIVQERLNNMVEGLGIEVPDNPLHDRYYGLVDFEFWANKYVGPEVVAYMKEHIHPLDIVFRLAEDYGIVLLNGGGFAAPDWSVRVSFANLDDEVYSQIGRATRAVARGYKQAYEAYNEALKVRVSPKAAKKEPEPAE